jgi:ribosome-associated toxin RatA of RatAB toxin-antitoxin module
MIRSFVRMRYLIMVVVFSTASQANPSASDWASRSKSKPQIEEQTSTKDKTGINGIKGLEAQFVVHAEPDKVLALLWDVRLFPELFPDIDKMTVVASTATTIDVHFKISAMVKDVEYTLRRVLDPAQRTIRWQEIGDGDVKYIRGWWKVESGSKGFSVVTYASFVDVGYAVPTGLVRSLAIRKVDEMANRVRHAIHK